MKKKKLIKWIKEQIDLNEDISKWCCVDQTSNRHIEYNVAYNKVLKKLEKC